MRAKRNQTQVLIVDDDEISRCAGQSILEGMGIDVATASSGQEALECVKTKKFDVILLDICLPGMNGFEVSVALREAPLCQNTEIIAISGDDAQSKAQGIHHECDRFLSKPFDPETLGKCLRTPGKKKKRHCTLVSCEQPDVVLDWTHGLNQFRGVWSAYAEILCHVDKYVAKFTCDFKYSMERKDAAECQRMAHSLKGSMAFIGAWKINAAAKQLEMYCSTNNMIEVERLFPMLRDMLRDLVVYSLSICHQSSPPVSTA
jgi:CheY-like chemotaxis protein